MHKGFMVVLLNLTESDGSIFKEENP